MPEVDFVQMTRDAETIDAEIAHEIVSDDQYAPEDLYSSVVEVVDDTPKKTDT